jgi:hypothetical protein
VTTAPLLSSLVPTAPGTRFTVQQTVARIEEEVAIIPRQAPPDTTHLAIPAEEWTWQQLRDYVINQIERTVGVQPRQPSFKEEAIFTGFIKRHGARRASQIARHGFEVCRGYWKNAPISVNRFCANSDPYFAAPIIEHLTEVETAAAIKR